MSIPSISWHNLKAKPLTTLLSVLLFALGVSIISLMFLINTQLEEKFSKNMEGIDLVVGAKGSPLQLILSSIYHVDFPTGNVKPEEARLLTKNPMVAKAIPLGMGDNYKGYRIIGTNHQYPALYELEIGEGELWERDFEVSIGSTIAEKLNLHVGSTFYGAHGMEDDGLHQHEEYNYTVTGIFKQSGTVIDQLILTNMESVWKIHATHAHHHDGESCEHEHEEGHVHDENCGHVDHDENPPHGEEGHVHDETCDHDDDGHDHSHGHSHDGHVHNENCDHGPTPEEAAANLANHDSHDYIEVTEAEKEVTSYLVTFRNPIAAVNLPRYINSNTNMQAASPAFETNRLFSLMGVGLDTLKWLAFIIIFISGLSVFISLYNSLKERKYEVALMRVLGGSKWQMFLMVLLEGLFIALIGFVIGILLSHMGVQLLAGFLEESYRYPFTGMLFLKEELYLGVGAVVIGIISAIIPAYKAYKTDISQTLSQA